MTIALDTNVTVDLLRGRSLQVRQRFMQALDSEGPLTISLIVFHELRYGVARSPRPAIHLAQLEFLLQDLIIEPVSEADVVAAAEIRARLAGPGRGIGPYDCLIAGQALDRGWTLVTANTREFERVEGLKLEDWSRTGG